MAKTFLVPIDLGQRELRNARIQNLAVAPGSPVAGQIYYDTALEALRFFDGTDWIDVISSEGTITSVSVADPITSTGGTSPTIGIDPADGSGPGSMSSAHFTKLEGVEAGATANDTDANLRDRATHTGAQAISTVTGLQAALDSKEEDGAAAAAVTAHEGGTGVHTIAGVTGLQTALDNKLETSLKGANNGLAELDGGGKVPTSQLPAIAITSTSVVADITARNALTVQEGDVAIVTDAGGGESSTFIYDGTQWLELLSPTDGVTAVTGGTGITSSGGNTPEISITAGGVDTTQLADGAVETAKIADEAVTEDKLSTAVQTKLNTAGALKYAETIGDAAATTFNIDHALGTRDVTVAVYQVGSPYAEVETDVERETINRVVIRFSSAPASNEYRVVVVG